MSDELLFMDETEDEVVGERSNWKVLIVDDEPEVHAVTKLALSDFVFQDKGIEFISAYSGAEAKEIFLTHNDIAIVLLDVVMETDDAGLQVAEFIRNDANNHFTRIILRTGQPGQAPERDVIINYDINDYKSKTELTAQKLFTVVIATLRSYRDIIVIEENRQGLEKIIAASADLFSIHSLENFIDGIVQQLSSLIGGTQDAAYITSAVAGPRPIDNEESSQFYIFSGKGDFANHEGQTLDAVLDGEQLASCNKALEDQDIVYQDEYLVAYCNSKTLNGSLLYLSGLPRKLTPTDKHLLQIFSQNVQIAFDNVLLTKDIEDTQREIVERLGQALERQMGGGKHIQRMTMICELLGREYGLEKEEINILKLAIPLHDVGKLKIPEAILLKPGQLNDEEKEVVRHHTEFGYQLLKDSRRPIIQAAAKMARDHHEHWDGNGYPQGLKGDEISIFSRITALADVFDALQARRCYKDAWPMEKVLENIQAQRGKQFEPKLVDILLDNKDKLEAIAVAYPDDLAIQQDGDGHDSP
ncbi:DUF3369 domain-containing protein [Lacimicrobium alkaliphilum]|uniref:Metal-dependent phosphohydrolase n=1 Tax=Lacimicrobium alkaliphilum TaxID=1526571 RepID=A0A0U3AJG6_9ALTE|nr:DUF3369 domain-containing protein [Lacimicrobium alkaliphilum]ALS98130.1 metal-dependent phosphohydrolase [Lacimicrobium alkaliphilum]